MKRITISVMHNIEVKMKLFAKLKEFYLNQKVHGFKLESLAHAHNTGNLLTRFYLIAYFHSINRKYFQSREALITLVEKIYEKECSITISTLPTYNVNHIRYSNFDQCFKDTVYALRYSGYGKRTLLKELEKVDYV